MSKTDGSEATAPRAHCQFCGTYSNIEPSCATFAEAIARTEKRPYGCSWFTKQDREAWLAREARVNRESQFADMVGALEHALARFRCLEEQFEESGDTASWAMCSVDADRMEKTLSNIKAST